MKPYYYCDHAATTPCSPDVWARMGEFATQNFGNPSSFHALGLNARTAIEHSRGQIAELLGASASEIVFTSGGSESINLALRGGALANRHLGLGIVTTATEHEATLQTCRALNRENYRISYLIPDANGLITPEQVEQSVTADTAILSILHANNETGTIQPLAELIRAARRSKPSLLIHADAVQSVGHIPVNVQELDVDLLSFTAHKFYGPKGVGAVYVRQGTKLEAEIVGGSQECGLRSGTESVPLIVGMAAALKAAVEEMDSERAYWRVFRDKAENAITSLVPNSRINGQKGERLDHFLHMSVFGIQGEDLVLALDREGIGASSGSACNLSSRSISHVLEALGLSPLWNRGSLRLTFGHASRGADPLWLANRIAEAVAELRSISVPPLRRTRHLEFQTS